MDSYSSFPRVSLVGVYIRRMNYSANYTHFIEREQKRVATIDVCPCSAMTLLAFEISLGSEFYTISFAPRLSN